MNPRRDPNDLLNTKTAAAYLGISPRWLSVDRLHAAEGGESQKVPHVQIGPTVRYKVSDLDAYRATGALNFRRGRKPKWLQNAETYSEAEAGEILGVDPVAFPDLRAFVRVKGGKSERFYVKEQVDAFKARRDSDSHES
ncbi:helix-turn-helix domain-containing protein [Paracoccus suum]|uniref:helix-turn-helix domain-containing protein n=1 Tax=Paracoccus suum TaxID=2259340 RepID=UPI0018EF6B6C|nr:helix-turn-helix domain-containing protein [Paracoccus suum]